jgi:hypothetical protein
MSKSSPSDLATAFRSFARRAGEGVSALEGDAAAQATARTHVGQVQAAVESAAHAVGTPVGPDLAATANALAERMLTTDPERWDEGTLDRLRALALEAGGALRAIDALAP